MTRPRVVAARDLAADAAGGVVAAAAHEAIRELGSGKLTVGWQDAGRWSRALTVKYEMARQRGIEVEGLEDFVGRLAGRQGPVGGVTVESGDHYFLVALDEELVEIAWMRVGGRADARGPARSALG